MGMVTIQSFAWMMSARLLPIRLVRYDSICVCQEAWARAMSYHVGVTLVGYWGIVFPFEKFFKLKNKRLDYIDLTDPLVSGCMFSLHSSIHLDTWLLAGRCAYSGCIG